MIFSDALEKMLHNNNQSMGISNAPTGPDRVAASLAGLGGGGPGGCRFEISQWGPPAIALPCAKSDLPGNGGLLGHGDGGCGLVSGGSRARARVGAQDPDKIPMRVIHFGSRRGCKGTATVACGHAVLLPSVAGQSRAGKVSHPRIRLSRAGC